MNNFFISENSPINTVLDFFVTILTRSNGGDFVTKFACIRAPQYDHTYQVELTGKQSALKRNKYEIQRLQIINHSALIYSSQRQIVQTNSDGHEYSGNRFSITRVSVPKTPNPITTLSLSPEDRQTCSHGKFTDVYLQSVNRNLWVNCACFLVCDYTSSASSLIQNTHPALQTSSVPLIQCC